MKESAKTRKFRDSDFYSRYFKGRTIDIGCGDDLVVANAEPFDMPQGDANEITKFRPAAAYDTVYSSHCLEHMRDVPKALAGWWELVKPGGFLIVVVPDEDLYEQGFWPSLFNGDHKATFRLCRSSTWSPVSYDLCDLMAALPGSEPTSIARQDDGYIYAFRRCGGADKPKLRRFLRRTLRSMKKRRLAARWLEVLFYAIATLCRCPIDQTSQVTVDGALAQMEIIARKREDKTGSGYPLWEAARNNIRSQELENQHAVTIRRRFAPSLLLIGISCIAFLCALHPPAIPFCIALLIADGVFLWAFLRWPHNRLYIGNA
jgi:SAM-dependent methyltransferase